MTRSAYKYPYYHFTQPEAAQKESDLPVSKQLCSRALSCAFFTLYIHQLISNVIGLAFPLPSCVHTCIPGSKEDYVDEEHLPRSGKHNTLGSAKPLKHQTGVTGLAPSFLSSIIQALLYSAAFSDVPWQPQHVSKQNIYRGLMGHKSALTPCPWLQVVSCFVDLSS